MPELEPTRTVIQTSGLIDTPTLQELAAQVVALQAQVAGLLTESRAWNATASAVTELQAQVAPLVGHTHQISEYQYTVATTLGSGVAAVNTVWTIPAIGCLITNPLGIDSVEISKPVQTGPPVPPPLGF